MFNWFNNSNGVNVPNETLNNAISASQGRTAPAPDSTQNTNFLGMQVDPMTATTGGFSGEGFVGNLGMAFGGVQALGNLWNAYNQNKMAKQQFNFQKDAYRTSLADNRQTYNSALEDRIRSRYNTEGRSSNEADTYLQKNRLGG